MGDSTHTLTASRIGSQDTMQVTVPADVQREEGIAIDDEVEVAIIGVSGLIDRASFEGNQTAGDRVTIPAKVARQLELVAGEEYEFEFNKVEESLDDADYAVADEDIEDELDDIEDEVEEDEGLGDLFTTDDEEEQEDEQEEEGLGELFG